MVHLLRLVLPEMPSDLRWSWTVNRSAMWYWNSA